MVVVVGSTWVGGGAARGGEYPSANINDIFDNHKDLRAVESLYGPRASLCLAHPRTGASELERECGGVGD